MDESAWIRELKKLKIRLLFTAYTALSEFICMKVIQHKTEGGCVYVVSLLMYIIFVLIYEENLVVKDCCQHNR